MEKFIQLGMQKSKPKGGWVPLAPLLFNFVISWGWLIFGLPCPLWHRAVPRAHGGWPENSCCNCSCRFPHSCHRPIRPKPSWRLASRTRKKLELEILTYHSRQWAVKNIPLYVWCMLFFINPFHDLVVRFFIFSILFIWHMECRFLLVHRSEAPLSLLFKKCSSRRAQKGRCRVWKPHVADGNGVLKNLRSSASLAV